MWFINKKRYFIVNYTADGGSLGQMTIISINCFLGHKRSIEIIKDAFPNVRDKTVILTGIIELNKKDYQDWCNEKIT